MDEQSIREHAQDYADALRSGDIGEAAKAMSPELQRYMGPVVAMLPLPFTEATVESVDMTGKAYVAVLHLVGDEGAIRLETRWKERDGQPTIVEASHQPEAPPPPPVETEEAPQADAEA
jgi:hypothetical protein